MIMIRRHIQSFGCDLFRYKLGVESHLKRRTLGSHVEVQGIRSGNRFCLFRHGQEGFYGGREQSHPHR